MKVFSRHRGDVTGAEVEGTVRMDRRLGGVLRKAHPGDIAVIDHLDLDRAQAEALLDQGVAAVVNAAPFISGRYPNLGPELLARAGVMLVDDVGTEVFSALRDGGRVRVEDGTVYVRDVPAVSGRALDLDDVRVLMDDAREGLTTQLESFTHNTAEFLRREPDLLLHGRGAPQLDVSIAGRPVVVVVRGFEHETDLQRMRRFIREQKPVLIGVDGGADLLLAARLRPDVVIVGEEGFAGAAAGQTRAVSDRALTQAREVVVHGERDERVPGEELLDRLGVRAHRITAGGTAEDIALLLADLEGASLIVLVGTHATLDEFLDRQRRGLASTFLTRLRVGPRLVDAKSVPTLYAGGARLWHAALVLLAGLLALAVAVAVTPVGSDWFDSLLEAVQRLATDVRGMVT
ncbi:MAG: hypothetical protein QOK15_536 [Nocardioidaceae bacterium]|jgi:uncharacterized membrane-anchored protein|nr:hypothetical protein [Nocardioidaceae bacterium]